jgi:predicted secreted protein
MAITTAKGTLVKIGDGASPEVFATIGQVRSIDGPSTAAEIVDTTTHSTSGNWREKLAVLVDPGEIAFDINFDSADTTHAFTTGLWNEMVDLTQSNYKVVFPNSAGTLAFAGYVSKHAFSAPVDNVLTASVSLAIDGAITAT